MKNLVMNEDYCGPIKETCEDDFWIYSRIHLLRAEGLTPKIKRFLHPSSESVVYQNLETGRFVDEKSALEILLSQD